ncbi:MAG: histidine kinase [Eubacteriales bacterium]
MTRKIAESRRDVLIQVSDDVINIRENAESNFELYWYNCFVSLQYIESEYELVERFLNIGTMFYKTNDMSNDNYEYVFVLDSGFSYASNGNHEAYSLEEYRREVWYLDLLENTDRAIWVSTYEDDANEGDYIISLVRPMLDEEDHIVGLFLLNISEEVIYNTYANIIGDNEIYIIDKEGRIFSHSNKDMLGILFYDMDTFNSMFEDEETGNYNEYQIIAKSGEDVLFSKLTPDGQEWTFVEEIPLNIVLADVTRLTNSLKICAVISVFIALVAIFLISHYMTKPLKELVKQLELVGRDTSDETHFHVTGWEEVHKICDECNFMDQRIRNLIFEVQESERDKSKAELGFLQAQMSPHFMYNTLFSIKCLVDMDDKEGAIDTLNSFTAILKYILSYSSEYVTVSEEIVLLEDYVKLQKVLYGDRFDLEIHCHPDLYNKNILRMIIQPLVENSLQHGIAGDKSQVIVDVTFQIELEQLCIYVVDDGVGFNNYNLEKLYKKVDKIVDKIEESKEHASSNLIGLNNIRQRIKKRYGEEYGIFIDSNYEDGARIIVKLPKEIGDE